MRVNTLKTILEKRFSDTDNVAIACTGGKSFIYMGPAHEYDRIEQAFNKLRDDCIRTHKRNMSILKGALQIDHPTDMSDEDALKAAFGIYTPYSNILFEKRRMREWKTWDKWVVTDVDTRIDKDVPHVIYIRGCESGGFWLLEECEKAIKRKENIA